MKEKIIDFDRKNVNFDQKITDFSRANTDYSREIYELPVININSSADFAGETPIGIQEENSKYLRSKSAKSLLELPINDFKNFILLCILYFLQGIPVGLAFGSIPFILKSKLSYGQVGIFSLAAYPYSLKLLWSPIIDSIYFKSFGRRKSWIIPIQFLCGIILIYLGKTVPDLIENISLVENLSLNLKKLTFIFFNLILLCATQDIAVDGWALNLISLPNLHYASTAQTIGINSGYFTSFTIFLALSSPDFANKYFRSNITNLNRNKGLINIGQYLTFSGWLFIFTTLLVFFFSFEKPEINIKTGLSGTVSVYRSMWKVIRLKNVQTFILIQLISKIGFQANEAVTNLKLLEKGFKREDLALTVLIDFPFEIIFGYYTAKWSSGSSPLKPWLWAYIGRIICAILAQFLVYSFPVIDKNNDQGVPFYYLLFVIIIHITGSFMSTVQFVSINAFHTMISDPIIGGTYMTTLNTISNFGGQWSRILVLFSVDWLTKATCFNNNDYNLNNNPPFTPFSCVAEYDKQKCSSLGGQCNVQIDGYYLTNTICIITGIFLYVKLIRKSINHLQSLSLDKWRV